MTIKHFVLTLFCIIAFEASLSEAASQNQCLGYYNAVVATTSSFNEVLAVMESNSYPVAKPPLIPITMWKWFGKKLSFFVGQRSGEILKDTRDYRLTPMEKPIHSMGVGLVGNLKMFSSQWSGIFEGGDFPVLARASISQGNPLKLKTDGSAQKRSTAMAIKIFNTMNPDEKVNTANAVFQNNLNGLLNADGTALNFLESAQTNNPNVDFSKVKYSYEWLTLIGVALGSFRNPKDRTSKFPFINPQIRPVHSWGELGVEDPKNINTPTWVKIEPRNQAHSVEESDFRLEIQKSMEANGQIVYDVFASDTKNQSGEIQWQSVGELTYTRAILSEGVDKNLLFHHDSLNSKRSGIKFELPAPTIENQTGSSNFP